MMKSTPVPPRTQRRKRGSRLNKLPQCEICSVTILEGRTRPKRFCDECMIQVRKESGRKLNRIRIDRQPTQQR
jgi:hypothetical protein